MKPTRAGLWVLVFLTRLLVPVGVAMAGDTPQPAPSAPEVAILGAMTVEVEELEQQLTNRKEQTVRGIRFVTGVLKGRTVVLAKSGMGEVNAARTAILLVEHFQPAV
jgi:hypothetical protein